MANAKYLLLQESFPRHSEPREMQDKADNQLLLLNFI